MGANESDNPIGGELFQLDLAAQSPQRAELTTEPWIWQDLMTYPTIILIIAFAFKGQSIKKKGVQKYVGRVKEYGRCQRRHSSFYIGLYGQSWVDFMTDSRNIVEELIRINFNKLENYLRGLRAMNLILNAS